MGWAPSTSADVWPGCGWPGVGQLTGGDTRLGDGQVVCGSAGPAHWTGDTRLSVSASAAGIGFCRAWWLSSARRLGPWHRACAGCGGPWRGSVQAGLGAGTTAVGAGAGLGSWLALGLATRLVLVPGLAGGLGNEAVLARLPVRVLLAVWRWCRIGGFAVAGLVWPRAGGGAGCQGLVLVPGARWWAPCERFGAWALLLWAWGCWWGRWPGNTFCERGRAGL